MGKRLLDGIIEYYTEDSFISLDGLEEAVIGVNEKEMVLCYSIGKIIEIYMTRDKMDLEEAEEFFTFNVQNAHYPKQPIFVEDRIWL